MKYYIGEIENLEHLDIRDMFKENDYKLKVDSNGELYFKNRMEMEWWEEVANSIEYYRSYSILPFIYIEGVEEYVRKKLSLKNDKIYLDNITNLNEIDCFDELDKFLITDFDGEPYFYSKDDFEWWQELANALFYLQENDINIHNDTINELEDYIRIANDYQKTEIETQDRISADLRELSKSLYHCANTHYAKMVCEYGEDILENHNILAPSDLFNKIIERDLI